MKKIILFIAFTGLILSANAQDTLKLKTIKTYYGDIKESYYYRIGELDGAAINTDTLSLLIPELLILNVSNDTFSSGVRFEYIIDFYLYADTGLLSVDRNVSLRYPIPYDFFPNDTIDLGSIGFKAFPLLGVIKEIEGMGIDFEQISYWKIITGISYTSKDGTYSEKVFYEGADTSVFYIVRGDVGVKAIEQNTSIFTLYPNPANESITIDNEGIPIKEVCFYNLVGQKVKQMPINATQANINIQEMPPGMYIIKINTAQGMLIKKTQIIR